MLCNFILIQTNKLVRSTSDPLLASMRLVCAVSPGRNTLAYLSVASVTKKKGFITLTLSINVTTLYPHTDTVAAVRLGLKQPGTNTLAYLSLSSATKKKGFITLTLNINAMTLLSSYRKSRSRETWPETTRNKHSSLFVCCVSDEE
jgi:hypothetical protein